MLETEHVITRRQFTTFSAAVAAGGLTVSGESGAASATAGFHVPGEERPHELTFMQWPVSLIPYSSRAHRLGAQKKIAEIANIISAFEPVVMLMEKLHEAEARKHLSDQVEIWDIPTGDHWCRDSGPLFMVDGTGGLAISHLNFNGWGGRWLLPEDAAVARRVAERLGLEVFDNGLVGEPGGVEQDGEGTLLAHESSWVHDNRNPGLNRDAVEALLLEAYGAEKIIWAPGLKDQDVTDYHIDSLARFVAPGHVAIQIGPQAWPSDPWSAANIETLSVLEEATDAKGRTLNVTKIPDPELDTWDSVYANYYVFNGGVLCSTTADRSADRKAKAILRGLYPDRDIMMIDTDILGRNGGGIHCSTQQMPKV